MNIKYLQESLNKSMILSEFLNVLDELTIRDSPISGRFNDSKLFAKEKFLELLKSKNLISDVPELELYRQKELPSGNNRYYEITATTLREKSAIDKDDTFWTTDLIPGVVFTIKIGVDVNILLSRPRQIKKGGKLTSNLTEILHECFFVISLADQVKNGHPTMAAIVTNIKTLTLFCSSLKSILGNTDRIVKTISDIDMHEKFEPETIKRMIDAESTASKVLAYLAQQYPNEKFRTIDRVFKAGSGGKKTTADAIALVGKDTVSISLKYRRGQLSNISVKSVIQLLFGIDIESDTFLQSLWRFDNDAVDYSLQSFIRLINSNLKFEGKLPETISYPEYIRNPKSNTYSILYEKITDRSLKKQYFDSRRYMNAIIDKFLKQKAKKRSVETHKENLARLMGYVLRSEENSSYIYVSDSGNIIYSVPSLNSLRKQDFSLKISPTKDDVNFSRDMELNIDGKPIIQFDLIFRWTKGQWRGDFAQVGRKLKINPYEWKK